MGELGMRGVIEGFYGRPWTWGERAEVMAWCAARAMTHYLYAPKDDPLHRARWREPYPDDTVREFERLVAHGTLRVGFAISPGLSMDYGSGEDRAALARKVDQMVAIGIDLVCLALDDIDVRPGLGEEHAEVTSWLRDHLDGRAHLVLVPTEYTGTRSTAYLDALAGGVPDDVAIGWTGVHVVNDEITEEQAAARAASLGGRKPFLWDNYPVNDGMMVDRLFLVPLRGRAPALRDGCAGYAANPMVQPRASTLPLSSIAAFLRGEDPVGAWERDADALGWRVFAEACDGVRAAALVEAVVSSPPGDLDAGAVDALDEWLRAACACTAPGLEQEAAAWIEQVAAEAEVGRCAVRLLRALPDNNRAVQQAMALSFLWPAARRAAVTVMGPRCAFRPVLGQWPDGEWRYHAASLIEDANAIDALVRYALTALDQLDR